MKKVVKKVAPKKAAPKKKVAPVKGAWVPPWAKKAVEEKIEDLVKKSKSSDINSKDYNPKVEKVLDEISELDLSEKQIEELLKALEDKKNNPSKTKNI